MTKTKNDKPTKIKMTKNDKPTKIKNPKCKITATSIEDVIMNISIDVCFEINGEPYQIQRQKYVPIRHVRVTK